MRTTSLLVWLLLSAFILTTAAPARQGVKYPLWDGKETVAGYAKRAKLAPTLTLDLGDGVQWEGVLIPAGAFVMGSPAGEARTAKESALEKQHKATISQPFYMGKYELTQGQFVKVMGVNPSRSKGNDLPVHNVSWQDADAFCAKLSKKVARQVLLPTEAQWEYACRAGTDIAPADGRAVAPGGASPRRSAAARLHGRASRP